MTIFACHAPLASLLLCNTLNYVLNCFVATQLDLSWHWWRWCQTTLVLWVSINKFFSLLVRSRLLKSKYNLALWSTVLSQSNNFRQCRFCSLRDVVSFRLWTSSSKSLAFGFGAKSQWVSPKIAIFLSRSPILSMVGLSCFSSYG